MRARRQDLSTRALEEEYLGLALNLITQSQQSRLSSVGRVQDPTYFQAHLQSLGRRAKMNTTADQTKLLDPDIEDLSLMATEKTTNSRRKVLLGFSIGILLLLSCWAAHVAPSSTSSLQKSTGPLKLAKRASNYAESVRVGGDLLMQLAGAGPGHPTSPVTHDTLFNGASGWNSATATDEGIPWLLLPIDSALRRFFDLDIHSDEESDHVTWEQNSRFMLGGRERPPSHAAYDAVYNPPAGVLVVTRIKNPHKGRALPSVHQIGDILALEYINRAATTRSDARNLRAVLFQTVRDAETLNTMRDVLRRTHPGATAFPTAQQGAIVLDRNNNEPLRAMVGTPLGKQVALMLERYRGQLSRGYKTISGAKIFKHATGGACVIFELAEIQRSGQRQGQQQVAQAGSSRVSTRSRADQNLSQMSDLSSMNP